MKTVTEKLSNGNTIKYKEINGTCYHVQTDKKVCDILEDSRKYDRRIKIYFGDTKTGKDWMEENDTIGTVGRSMGNIKIPILINNVRSMGGGAILDHCIVKIKDIKTGVVLYQHPKYNRVTLEIVPSDLPDYAYNINSDGSVYSRHKSLRSAELLKSKLS